MMPSSMPIAMPTKMTPTKAWIGTEGEPITRIALKSRPSSTPLIAPDRAAVA